MMFDGAVVATVADTAAPAPSAAPAADAAPDASAGNSGQAGSADNNQGSQDLQASPVSDGQSSARKEIVFVDTRAPNYQELLKGVSSSAEVMLLSTNKDGVQQIADALAGRTDSQAPAALVVGCTTRTVLVSMPFSLQLDGVTAGRRAIRRAQQAFSPGAGGRRSLSFGRSSAVRSCGKEAGNYIVRMSRLR